ncbi:hypothetical protein ACTQX2_11475 [Megamonas funiformis]|uniref:hypothetical protein n=1 Tax=Megamonas funiformis TaxID=437897 RepID=UPI003F9AB977
MKNLLVKVVVMVIVMVCIVLSGCKTANINSEGSKELMLQNHYINILSVLENSYCNTDRMINNKEIQSIAKVIVDCKSKLKNIKTPTIIIVEGECPDLTYKSIKRFTERYYVNFNTGSNCVSFDKETNTITVYMSNGVADGFDVVIGISNSIDKLIK